VSRDDGFESRLAALDAETGGEKRVQDLSLASQHPGVRSIIVAHGALYAVDATELLAYDAETGQQRWVATLGTGHVGVVPQAFGQDVLVYYGDSLIRVPASGGHPISRKALGSLLWVRADIEIHSLGGGMVGIDPRSGQMLWQSREEPFYLSEGQAPADAPHGLLVPVDGKLCLLDLRSGRYAWCLEDSFPSNAVVVPNTDQAFVLDDRFNLLSIDLSTGRAETAASYPGGMLPSATNTRYEYYLAASTSRLFLYFGDSCQLFSMLVD
jgi:outer membrane protein assembly factor BamB